MLLTEEEPYKFGLVEKGDTIPTGAIEQWAHLGRDHPLFWAALLKCRQHVETLLREQHRPATVRVSGQILRVLTDREATVYLHQRFINSEQRMRHAHLRAEEIDLSALRDDERRSHQLRLQLQGMHLEAIDQVSQPRKK